MSLTVEEAQALSEKALEAAKNSYSPYSRFRVGAAVLLESGEVVTGTNVENASYRLTTCAEQAAIVAAVSRFGPAIRIRAVAIGTLNGVALSPCGACRQTILEFASPETLVLHPDAAGGMVTTTVEEMLPSGFRL